MKAWLSGFVVLVIGVAYAGAQVPLSSGDGKSDFVSRWEYRVLSKAQIIELGKKDLAVGLNTLGDEGWELVAIDTSYIFKRPKDRGRRQAEDLKSQILLIESDVEQLKDRVAWAERMFKKGFMSANQAEAERLQLKRAQMALERARKDLEVLPADAKKATDKEHKPEK